MEEQNLVKVRLKFKEGADLPATETMWAEPVETHDGGGTYRLMNTSFMVPLAAGDVVRAEIDGWGGLQVVNAVEPCDRGDDGGRVPGSRRCQSQSHRRLVDQGN